MSRGRIARTTARQPVARQRAGRYPGRPRSRRGSTLPPHLLRGLRRGKRSHNRLFIALAALVGAFALSIVGLVVLLVVGTVGAVAGTVEAYREVNAGLPDPTGVVTSTFQTTRIFDRNGVLLQEVSDPETGWRTFVTLDEISPYLIDATISSEDATYWSHLGIEPIAIARGVAINFGGTGSSGGSTITQQLVRALYPEEIGFDISATRKFREALAAVALEQNFSKEDILTMYLNQIYYGQRSYGIEAAAQTFFSKHASELTLGEASLLAGLPQAPSFYDPTVRFEIAKKRQSYVLDQMVKYGYITRAEADAAFAEPLSPGRRSGAILQAPHFTNYVKQWIIDNLGEDALYRSGLQFTTSIDVELQETAQGIVRQGVADLGDYRRNNAAAVVVVPWSGEIIAMVGSANFDDPAIGGQVNYATALLQPGSSMKPMVYAAAFEAGWNPGTVVFDTTFREPTPGAPFPYYEPQNYSGLFNGPVTVRTALSNSFNIPAVKAAKYVGVDHVLDLGRRMGYVNSLPGTAEFYGIAVALGSGEVQLVENTAMYATFANNGAHVPLHPVIKVTDAQGNVLYDIANDPSVNQPEQALKAEYAYQITSILTDNESRSLVFGANNRFGNTQEELGRPTAAKSGTTDNWQDLWTMGYTSALAVGVWVGNTNAYGQAAGDLPEIDGIASAGPIWQELMFEVHQNPQWAGLIDGPDGQPIADEFPVPPGIYEGEVCAATGNRATGSYATRTELLVRGEGPALPCDQLSAYQARELEFALQDFETNGSKYTSRATGNITRYRDAALYGRDASPIEASDDQIVTGDTPPDNESPPIVQR